MSIKPTPEAIHGDVTRLVDQYHALSVAAATNDDAFTAVHAAWAADVMVVQSTVLESVLMGSPHPDRQFSTVAAAATRAMVAYATTPTPPSVRDARSAVVVARQSLAAVFDAHVLSSLEARYRPLEHLASVGLPHPASARMAASTRLDSQSPSEWLTQKSAAATAFATAAADAVTVGDNASAIDAMYNSDVTTVEAYLVEAALQAGDADLVSCHLRWMLVCQQIAAIPGLPNDLADAVAAIRRTITATLGAVDSARLAERWQQIPVTVE